MASAKSGKAGSVVAPAQPKETHDADNAEPGEVSKAKAEAMTRPESKYGKTKVPVFKPPDEEKAEEKQLVWIEFELVGEDDKGIPGEQYKVTTPDGQVAEGTLDQNGFARIDGLEPGTCKICFPKLDKEAWEKI